MKPLKSIFLFSVFMTIACNSQQSNDESDLPNTDDPYICPIPFSYESDILYILECMNMPRPTDSYNYPVYPGMEEWKNFKTAQEMVDACQIPVATLKRMSTQAIIQAIWEYPFLFEVLHRVQYQMDFEGTFLKNNAYQELTKRKDTGVALLERYLLLDPIPPGAQYYTQKVFEILISQTVFLSLLEDNTKKNLLKSL